MVTVLKPGINKIMYIFYKQRNEKIHLRELARETKMYGQSISRYLNELEKNKILKSEKVGNLKQYSLKHNKTAYTILTFFDVEKYEKLPHIRKTAIKYYLDALPHQPVFAILFGSTAKENFREDSDIDILLITNTRIDTKKAEYEADALSAMKISTFQMTYKDFLTELKLKNDKVVQSAIITGYPIVNHIQYYGVLYNEPV